RFRAVRPARAGRQHPAVGAAHRDGLAGAGRTARQRTRGGERVMLAVDWVGWALLVGRVVVIWLGVMITVVLVIWMERKVIADMQTRPGPLRAGPRGILITLADGAKLFFKEGITPTSADRAVYAIAPVI